MIAHGGWLLHGVIGGSRRLLGATRRVDVVSNPASDPAADTDRWHTIAVWRHQAAAHYAGGRDDQADAIATSPARLAGAISYWSLSDDGGSLTRVTTLSYYTAATLDGFIADPDDSLEWLFRQEQDNSGPLNYDEFIQNIGAIVMGSTTYEWSLDHQAKTGAPWPYSMPAWVMTNRALSAPGGADVRFATGDVRPVYDAMARAAGDKDLWVVGGGDLAGQFADAGLLDEVIVYVAPVTLGAGRSLLSRRLDLELVEVHRNGAFVGARYGVIGTLKEDRVADDSRG